MKRTILTLALIGTLAALAGCTQNQRAKNFGGTSNVQLPAGNKLVCATWKENHLWYLYRPMRTNEVAETSTLKESSSWGVLQGTVIFTESK